MQKQTDRIDESAREADFLNGKINELSLMNILRTQEFEEKLASLQAALREKSQKVNDLSVEIIEREIESNKKMDQASEQMTAKLQQLEGKCAQMGGDLQEAESVVNRLAEKLREAEEESCRLEELSSGKNHEINKIVSKMNGLEMTVKEKEKLVQFLQAELKAAKCDFKEVRLANRRLEEELEELREVIAVSEEKLKILKKDAVESIETELNNELEMDQLKRQVLKLESERTALTAVRNATQEQLQRAGEVIAELQAIGKDRLHQMVAHLTKSQANADDTTTFELLCE
jgi:chromosome segregation ATPase